MKHFDIEQFNQVAHEMEVLDAEFREHGIPERFKRVWNVTHNVGTWNVPRTTAEFLYQTCKASGAKHVLELGTSIGYSTMWFARAVMETGGKVATIEREPYKIETAKEFWKRAGVEHVIESIQGDIVDVVENWKEPIDFLFMDANKRGYFEVFKKLENHLKDGAIVVADNVTDMGDKMEDFIAYISNHPEFEVEVLEMDHGLLVATKK